MNEMEVTKIVAGLCGTFLILLLLGFGSDFIYASTGGHGGHGEEEVVGYKIETEADSGGEAEEEAPVDIEPLLASADIAAGEGVFKKCAACHALDGTDGTGPHLNGVVGRAVGGIEGFGYSSGMAEHGGNWDANTLNAFLIKPKAYIKGTKMGFAGLKKEEDRVNIIAYMQSLN